MDLQELYISQNENTHPWELARVNIVNKLISQISKKHKDTANKKTTVLDVGCGNAFVVSELSKLNTDIDFLGYDINFKQEYIDYLNNNSLKHITNLKISKELNNFGSSIQKVTLTLLLDVIEHIKNDIDFLTDLRNKIPEDSIFLITVPAFQGLFTNHDKFLRHYRRYNKKQIYSLMKKSGYKVIDCNYFFASLLVPRLLKKTLEKIKNSNYENTQGVSNWNKGRALTGIVKNLLLLDYKITNLLGKIGINLPGLSIYCVCQPAA